MSPKNIRMKKKIRMKSPAIKTMVFRLKEEGKSNAEIGRELGLSRQYVSFLLTSGRKTDGTRKNRDWDVARSQEVQATISRLEGQGEYGLAEILRVMELRRTKDK